MAKNELSRRSARCAKPIPKKDVIGGDLIPNEESASLWMWAWPRLLGWTKTINWLFSPVTGKARYPCSSHRTAIWRWLPLYRERIIPLFRDGKYERAVLRSLNVREKRSNPSPIFVGLVATARPDVPCLKDDGKSFKELRHKVGADRVHLRILRVREDGPEHIRIDSFTPE